ncbi:hypothetical protein FACS1894132_10260 [Clostridia bacterium]|nr:hypothetical protein FACS1894132_10260 [Clostridia bacterium]
MPVIIINNKTRELTTHTVKLSRVNVKQNVTPYLLTIRQWSQISTTKKVAEVFIKLQ